MKKNHLFYSIVAALLFAGTFLSFAPKNLVSGQERPLIVPEKQLVKPTAIVTARKNFKSTLPEADLKLAATQNINLKNSLAWEFGKKTQRGWYLYELLIQQTLDTNAAPQTAEFSDAVAVWQARHDLDATGVLDKDTFFEFVKFWQSERLNRSDYPPDDQLFSAPITDFYDPTRDLDLLKVERATYMAYKRLVAAAMNDKTLKLQLKDGELAPEEKFLKIISSFRSREYQAKLRAKSPNAGTAGLAVNSPHSTGCALDIYVGGEPVETKDYNRLIQIQTPVYRWLVKNAAKFGFRNYFYEPWHWEYVAGAEIKKTDSDAEKSNANTEKSQ